MPQVRAVFRALLILELLLLKYVVLLIFSWAGIFITIINIWRAIISFGGVICPHLGPLFL